MLIVNASMVRLGLLLLVATPVALAVALSSYFGLAAVVVAAGGGKAESTYATASISVGQSVAGRGASSLHGFQLGFLEAIDLGLPTAVGDDVAQACPYQLQNCAPNPFNPATTIRFSLSEATVVRLDVYDLRGRRIARLLDEPREPGFHSIDYRPTNLASGVYVLEMRAGVFRATRRMVLLK